MKKSIGSVFLAFVFLIISLGGCVPVSTPVPATNTPFPTPTPTKPPTTTPTSTAVVSIGQHPYSSNVQIETGNNSTKTIEVKYLLYLPGDYGNDPQKKWPLILFLHGYGERGNDLELLKNHPLPKTLDQQSDFPFIVLSPQLPFAMETWSELIDPLEVLLDNIQIQYSIDSHQVYLTGISMGGFGAWEFALRYPQRFAAVVPIAGGYTYYSNVPAENICDLKDLPIWVFHGELDTTVLPIKDEKMVDALKACGGNVQFTLYPDADHAGSWTNAYADPKLWEWLLEQRTN
jgi:predicted peptidase